jgi:hypothetical protein
MTTEAPTKEENTSKIQQLNREKRMRGDLLVIRGTLLVNPSLPFSAFRFTEDGLMMG